MLSIFVVSQPSFPEFFSEDWINGYEAEILGSLRCMDLCGFFPPFFPPVFEFVLSRFSRSSASEVRD